MLWLYRMWAGEKDNEGRNETNTKKLLVVPLITTF
jgi:hypothetical protein